MNKTKSIVVASLMAGLGLTACNQNGEKHRNPGRTYAPDMVYSRAYDAYTYNPVFADSQSSRLPVPGTVARGHELPDHLKEGDTTAYKTFTTNLRFSDDELKEGKRLFDIYCGICHGQKLDGQGPLFASGKFASMPANFKDAKYLHMPVGQMYAAVKFGKNAMGSYSSQLDIKQRWQVIAYIKKVQSENGGAPFALGINNVPANSSTPKADSSSVQKTGDVAKASH
ncbi:MAG: cytochrome c [Bacteroidetes bacterium]|nr:cytochrome c [Bacteroidota bacterium]MBS1740881.1 cytochrome c [Bacteroidota bacterium]